SLPPGRCNTWRWRSLTTYPATVPQRELDVQWLLPSGYSRVGREGASPPCSLWKGARCMLSREDNELVCRTGPDTPMGKLFRRYWHPFLLSSELPEPDGPPVRVKLLGEEL